MKSITLEVTIILTVALFYSCKDDTVSPNPEKLDGIIPLAIGNTWIYRNESIDSLGVIISTKYDSSRISKDTLVKNERWFTSNGSADYITNRSDGLYFSISNQLLWYKYPANVGDSVRIDEYYVRTVVSTTDTVVINRIQFIAYKYVDAVPNEKDVVNHYWYLVPHIGLVKMEFVNPKSITNNVIYRSELISYSLQ